MPKHERQKPPKPQKLINVAGEALISADEIEYVRGLIESDLHELAKDPLPEVRAAIIRGSPCHRLVDLLRGALRSYGYTDWLDDLGDTQHARAAFEHPNFHDEFGLCLVDALFVAMTFTDPHWCHTEEYLWRLCYRLAQIGALDSDSRRPAAKQKAKKAQLSRDGNTDLARKQACRYVRDHFLSTDGKPRSQVDLARGIWARLREYGRTAENSYMPPAELDGTPTRSSLDTIKRWFADEYRAALKKHVSQDAGLTR